MRQSAQASQEIGSQAIFLDIARAEGMLLAGQLSAWRHARVSNSFLAATACALPGSRGAPVDLQSFITHKYDSIEFTSGQPNAQVTCSSSTLS